MTAAAFLSLPGFFTNALLAASAIAVASGLIGWFVVLRGQVFAGDALSHVAFTGALGAAAAGVAARAGVFLASIAIALLMALLGRRARADDVTIGIVFGWVLGVGALCLDLFNHGAGGGDATIAARTLFGSVFGLDGGTARQTALVALGCTLALAAIARPLLLASLDAPLAVAARVPVRALGAAFLVLVGLDAAVATQAVGAMLLLGLLAAPAGAAHRLTPSPYRGMAIAVAMALLATWGGLALAYWVEGVPPGAGVVLVAVSLYALSISR